MPSGEYSKLVSYFYWTKVGPSAEIPNASVALAYLLLELQTVHSIFCFLKVPDYIIIWTHLVTNNFFWTPDHRTPVHLFTFCALMCASGLSCFPATLSLHYCYISRTGAEVSSLHFNLPLPCFSLLSPPRPSFLFSLYSTRICSLLPKYIQRNLITAIAFLLGWLTVHSDPPIFRVAQPHLQEFWSCHPSILPFWFSSMFSFTSLPFVVSSLYLWWKADVSLILYPPLTFFLLFLLLNLFELYFYCFTITGGKILTQINFEKHQSCFFLWFFSALTDKNITFINLLVTLKALVDLKFQLSELCACKTICNSLQRTSDVF